MKKLNMFLVFIVVCISGFSQSNIYSKKSYAVLSSSGLPFVFHNNFDLESQSYPSMFKANSAGEYTILSVRVGADDRKVYLEKLSPTGSSLSPRNVFSRPTGGDNGSFDCVSGDISDDGSIYLLNNYYKAGEEWSTVFKISENGDSIWEKIVSEKWLWSSIVLTTIKCVPGGGCVLAGRTNAFPSASRIVKLSSEGTVEYSTDNFSGDYGYNRFYNINVNSNGDIFATGIVHNNLNNRSSVIVTKINADLSKSWEKVYYSGLLNEGDMKIGTGECIIPTSDGGCVVGGFESEAGKYGGYAVLRGLDASGETKWMKKYFYTGDDWQDANVLNLVNIPSSENFLAYCHRDAGNTNAGATLMECNQNGDTLWTQVGYDYRLRMCGIDNTKNVLFMAASPHPATNWNDQRLFMKTTPEGIFQTPTPNSPFDNHTDISVATKFDWVNTTHINKTTHLQVATDSTFASVDFDVSGIAGSEYTSLKLTSLTDYYWRIRETGKQGNSSHWSQVMTFRTEFVAGVDDKDEDNNVFYNSITKELIVRGVNIEEIYEISIFDFSGRKVYAENKPVANGSVIAISLKEMNDGNYISKIVSKNKTIAYKFIK